MTALTGIEGELTVGILVVDATVADVRLRSTRATGIGAMLDGPPDGRGAFAGADAVQPVRHRPGHRRRECLRSRDRHHPIRRSAGGAGNL